MANFDTSPEFTKEIRKLEATDRAHADVFNALLQFLVKNEMYLRQRCDNTILIGTNDTDIPVGSTLFVTDGVNPPIPVSFEYGEFSNINISENPPDGTEENWGKIQGKLTVAEEAETDTVFFAQINSI